MQKDAHTRHVAGGDFQPLIGVKESEGEWDMLRHLEAFRATSHMSQEP